MKQTLIAKIANTVEAYKNCCKDHNDYADIHYETLKMIEKEHLPHGSGIDSGCEIDIDKSNGGKVIINTSFHHMDENGFYDGWTEHNVIVTPSFYGFHTKVTGKDKNMIKDYLVDEFYDALIKEVDMTSN